MTTSAPPTTVARNLNSLDLNLNNEATILETMEQNVSMFAPVVVPYVTSLLKTGRDALSLGRIFANVGAHLTSLSGILGRSTVMEADRNDGMREIEAMSEQGRAAIEVVSNLYERCYNVVTHAVQNDLEVAHDSESQEILREMRRQFQCFRELPAPDRSSAPHDIEERRRLFEEFHNTASRLKQRAEALPGNNGQTATAAQMAMNMLKIGGYALLGIAAVLLAPILIAGGIAVALTSSRH